MSEFIRTSPGHSKTRHRHPKEWIIMLVGGLVLVLSVMGFDYLFLDRRPWNKWPVDLSVTGLVRAMVIAFAAFLLIRLISPRASPASRREEPPGLAIAGVGSIGFLAVTVWLLLSNPARLTRLGREDGLLEYLSAAALLGAAVIMIMAFLRNRRRHKKAFFAPLLYFLIAGFFLLIFLEEISWGQRLLGFETPGIMARNSQGETNVHNFFTHIAEQGYYSLAMGAFILLPYGWNGRVSVRFTSFIPPPLFPLIAAPVAFLQAEMWNTVPMQLAVWGSLFILIDIARKNRKLTRYRAVSVAVICIVAQIIFLGHADSLQRTHDLSEYRETLIALLGLSYALSVFFSAEAGSRGQDH